MPHALADSVPSATPKDVLAAAARLGFTVPEGHEEDYLALLQGTDRAAQAILAQPDYLPEVDLKRFPRRDVHLPSPDDNPLRAWAWKATIEGARTGLLKGRTVTVKDTVCVAGVGQLFGTDAFTDFTPSIDATVVTRMLEAGATFVGKAACENFSHGAGSFSSSPYGPKENPYAEGFSTGGSSSGCGALIGGGLVDMGIGGDQGGSIRIPASLCGCLGLKPTFGLVPYTGVLSSEPGVDHVGPMARTALDTALLLEATAGYDELDDRQLGAPRPADVPKYSQVVLDSRAATLQGLRIGLLVEGFSHKALDPNVDACVRAAVDELVELDAMTHVINKFASSQTRQGRQVGRRGVYINEYFDKVLPWTQEKYDKAKYYVTGTSMSAEYGWANYPLAYGRAMNLTRKLKDDYDAIFADVDVLVMPTVNQPARRHAPPEAAGITSNTAAFNLTGHPALTIPVGFTPPSPTDIRSAADADIKLPCGLMLVGKMWDEATLLKVADQYERAHDWKA
ncbi:hypothetical protein Rhopal_000551-T1 [Rhodotorula paludigena]|uniref:Amidase domain-containing protein n=1 Tax=Rhodotorula paludigena TaxID=86838 RepID=A0AAV5GDB8_9BASI|nr:hypothetical protein Rhopal_000551-T1 [Rhodotorula paludigena]